MSSLLSGLLTSLLNWGLNAVVGWFKAEQAEEDRLARAAAEARLASIKKAKEEEQRILIAARGVKQVDLTEKLRNL